jgi:hypothetical protein
MIGDHHGRQTGRATLLVRATDELLGTHRRCCASTMRELICAAAALTEQDALRVSFVNALDTVRGPVGDPGAFPSWPPRAESAVDRVRVCGGALGRPRSPVPRLDGFSAWAGG